MAPLNILSLNVQGINETQKQTKAFLAFQTRKVHIVCVQETHFIMNFTPKYMSPFYPQIFTASDTTKQQGTLIDFHRSTPFTLQFEIIDPEGRYLILTSHHGHIGYHCLILCSEQTTNTFLITPFAGNICA